MATVFITQIPSRIEDGVWMPKVDVNPAKEFGTLQVLFPAGMNLHVVDADARSAMDVLRSFDVEQDFFLPMGDPLLMVYAAALLGGARRPFKMLKWDRHQRRYFTYEINP